MKTPNFWHGLIGLAFVVMIGAILSMLWGYESNKGNIVISCLLVMGVSIIIADITDRHGGGNSTV
ncbi:MAG TPA: hypothetical protein VFF15_08205 [Flavobacteriaceae bacterium]|nr:hypothetical protein [Flavobacteriaceae bacterium]